MLFFWTSKPLSTNWALFKCHSLPEYCCWPCSSLYDYSVPIFWCYFQQDVTKLKSSQTGFLNMTMSSLYSNSLRSHQTSINRAPLGCGGTGDLHHGCVADKSAASVWCYHVKSSWALLSFCYMWIHTVERNVMPHRTTVQHEYRHTTME